MSNPWAFEATPGSEVVRRASLTLVEGPAFCISAQSGDIVPDRAHGLFLRDTRFLSRLELRINERVPEELATERTSPFAATFVARSRPRSGQADSSLLVFRYRYVGQGMREDVVIQNYGDEAAYCSIEVRVSVDFADLFEVKEGRVFRAAGEVEMLSPDGTMQFCYRRGAASKGAKVSLRGDPRIAGDTASFEVIVPARGQWSTCIQLTPVIEGEEIQPRYRCGQPVEHATPQERLEQWRRDVPAVQTDSLALRSVVDQSAEDLGALRLFDPDYPERTVVAAGAPWFMTLFGRDSLITAWIPSPSPANPSPPESAQVHR